MGTERISWLLIPHESTGGMQYVGQVAVMRLAVGESDIL